MNGSRKDISGLGSPSPCERVKEGLLKSLVASIKGILPKQRNNPYDIKTATVVNILRWSGAQSCSFCILDSMQTPFQFSRTIRDGGSSESSAEPIYGIGSLYKLFIAKCLHGMISNGTHLRPEIPEILRGSWEEDVFQVINKVRNAWGKEGYTLSHDKQITIREALAHESGIPPMQQFLFAPDGSFLMGSERAIETLSRLIRASKGEIWGCYSNWNYIVAGQLISESFSSSLADALRKIVLDPLDMNDTILDRSHFEGKEARFNPN
jgi:CubicO group peptidase (beta-lactamase class C family)